MISNYKLPITNIVIKYSKVCFLLTDQRYVDHRLENAAILCSFIMVHSHCNFILDNYSFSFRRIAEI